MTTSGDEKHPPRIAHTKREIREVVTAARAAGKTIGLVPTMGALHEGHLSLVGEGRRHADRVWVSIFVNPTQFNDEADLSEYPRTLEADLRACEAAGVDVVFLPYTMCRHENGEFLQRIAARYLVPTRTTDSPQSYGLLKNLRERFRKVVPMLPGFEILF